MRFVNDLIDPEESSLDQRVVHPPHGSASPTWHHDRRLPSSRLCIGFTGAQEIASCLLSLGNLIAHVHCCLGLVKLCVSRGYRPSNLRGPSRLKHQEKTPCKAVGMNVCIDSSVSLTQLGEGAVRAYPFLPMWLLYALVHINAWLMSAIFHIRSDPSD